MRTSRFLFIHFVGISFFVSAQAYAQTLTAEHHLPLTTDSLQVYKLPYITVADSGRNCIWDFSGISTDSAEIIDADYFAPIAQDTMYIGLHREHTNSYYHNAQDTLWMTGYETSRTHVQYSRPVPLLHFPFVYGDSIQGAFAGKGQYCHILPLSVEGTCSTCVDAVGRLVLPDIEIDSVLRVRTQLLYHDRKAMQSIIYEDHYRWYSLYCRYPLLETVYIQTVRNADTATYAAAYYYPQEQENMPERKIKDEDIQIGAIDSLITDVSFMPNPVYSDLQVHYSLVRSAQVYISVHYNGGTSTYCTPLHWVEEGVHSVALNMSGMPIGNYVVYIHADDTVVSGNIVKL